MNKVQTYGPSFEWRHGLAKVLLRDGAPFVLVRWDGMEHVLPVYPKKSKRSKNGICYAAYIPGKDGSHNRTLNVPASCVELAEEVSA